MNYFKQLNQFYNNLPENTLSPNAQCLYCYLLHRNNELGWKKEFSIPNSIICGFTGLARKSLDRARNELKSKGYIDYKKGVSNKAGKYLIVCFDTHSDTHDGTQVTHTATHTTGLDMSTLNNINKTKLKETNNCCMQQAIDFYQTNINLLTPFEFEKLQDYSELDESLIVFAMQKAVMSNKRNFNYIEGILKNWKRKGIKTVVQAKQEEIDFKKTKQPKEETEEEKMQRKLAQLKGDN